MFGYVPTSEGVGYCQVIDVEAAAAITAAADMMLNGGTVSEVMRYWNDLGLKRPNGKSWTQPSSVQKVLSSPRIAGYTSDDGKAVREGNWPAIIDRATHEALVRACSPKVRHGKKPRKNLLPGVIFCECGSPMVANVSLKHGLNRYLCRTQRGGCGQVSRHKPWVDEAVHEYVKARIESEFEPSVDDPGPAVATLEAEIAEAEASIKRLREARTSTLTTADTLELWARDDFESLGARREILLTYVKMVIVKPLPQGRLWGIREALPVDCIQIVQA